MIKLKKNSISEMTQKKKKIKIMRIKIDIGEN